MDPAQQYRQWVEQTNRTTDREIDEVLRPKSQGRPVNPCVHPHQPTPGTDWNAIRRLFHAPD